MTIDRRAQLTVAILILIVSGTCLTLFWSSRELDKGMKRIDITSRAVHTAFMMRVLMNDYLHHGNARMLRQWKRHRAVLSKIIDEIHSDPVDEALLAELVGDYKSVSTLVPQVVRLMAEGGAESGLQDPETKDMLVRLVLLRLEQLVNAANDLSRSTQSLTLQRRNTIQQMLMVVGILGTVIIFTNVYLIRKSVVLPLKTLSLGAEKIGSGDFVSVPELRINDEVGSLSRAFNVMVKRLKKREQQLANAQTDLEIKVEERTAELQMANEKLEKLVNELRAKSEELERFAYTISHDLKAPLITIQSFVGIIIKEMATGNLKQSLEDLNRVRHAAQKMMSQLEGLLELSRVGRIVSPFQPVPFRQVINEALSALQGTTCEAKAQVIVADDFPTVPIDRVRMVQVLQNLVENACRFSGDHDRPYIEIGSFQENAEEVFYVKDHGIGLDPEYQDRVFELFSQLDPSSPGTGLGLALVKKIIEHHNGRVWVRSNDGEPGTTFLFSLPKTRII